jgi:hypothetical protein
VGTPTSRMIEQRTNSRMQTHLSCYVRKGEQVTPGSLLSVSLIGALLASNCDAARGDEISISLEIAESKKAISLYGKIVRTYQGYLSQEQVQRFGVRFNGITPESMLLVKTLIARKDAAAAQRKKQMSVRVSRSVP